MTLNGLIVDAIAIGAAAILTGLAMGLVLLLTEDRRGRIFMQEIPAKFRALVATPEHPASDWVKPMHRVTPAAKQLAAHLGSLNHLLPKVSPWRAAMLARNLTARATRARAARKECTGCPDHVTAPGSLARRYAPPGGDGPAPPAATERAQPPAPPPLPALPPDSHDASCTYTTWQPWPGDDTLTRMQAVK